MLNQWNSATNLFLLAMAVPNLCHVGPKTTQQLILSDVRDIDMPPTLAEIFMKSKGAPIDVDGVTVVNMYRKNVVDGQKLSIRFDAFKGIPEHGIRIKLQNGLIGVNGQKLKEVVVWVNTAPSNFEIICFPKDINGELRIWNCWRDFDGVTHAWIGNAGIVVEENEFETALRCSDGMAEFNPDSLTVSLDFNCSSTINNR